MNDISNKKFAALTYNEMYNIIGGKAQWVLKDTKTSWKCLDINCDNVLVYTEQYWQQINKKGEVTDARWERDPK